ncbi:hypothetical protein PLEOSDRAFT_1112819 [Pleurotus ostreatus PC15]|uniref:DUF218 domain-containing protein n=1 Tax=Pleurotus ostreatus (strain PC15) TaxID=1137138 RepID=A0A067NJH9_PLEO1|nr:hypothetical protein PLEOSDRAFT_1112819 [Pleurotus ostreatus PC15]
MLPIPVSFGERPRRSFSRKQSRRGVVDALLQRSRITNLGVILLAAFAVLSFLYNLRYYVSESYTGAAPPRSILATISRQDAEELNHLVIVPGHSIWTGHNANERLNEDDWILESYQRGGGRVAAFYDHIAKGAEIAVDDPHSLLVFSGGQTRIGSTTTEAESYMRLAHKSNAFNLSSPQTLFPRATTEDFALDSFQNLLFSIARFFEYTGRYPERITVVGYEMKRRRFVELHRAALHWPIDRFHYLGADPYGEEGVQAQDGENKNGYLPYLEDVYGCHSYLLAKRRQRNPFRRFPPYYASAPGLKGLFDWCPDKPTMLFDGTLPWST